MFPCKGAIRCTGNFAFVNFLMDEMGQRHRLQEGDGVDVVVGSDEVEPDKS
jgi:hypothetical protein